MTTKTMELPTTITDDEAGKAVKEFMAANGFQDTDHERVVPVRIEVDVIDGEPTEIRMTLRFRSTP